MVFIAFNIFISAVLFYTSFRFDRKGKNIDSKGNLVNMLLFLATIFLMMGITVFLCLQNNRQLALLTGRVTFLFMDWFSVLACNYILVYPEHKRIKGTTLMTILWFILAFYIVFFAPNGFNSIIITYSGECQVASGYVLRGTLGRQLPITWFSLMNWIYRFFIPLFVCFMVLVRAENTQVHVYKQNHIVNVVAVLLSWALFGYLKVVARFQPMVMTLAPLCFIPEILVFMVAFSKDDIWDAKLISKNLARFALVYVVPSGIAILAFMILWPVVNFSELGFLVLVSIFAGAAFVSVHMVKTKFKKLAVFRDSRYASDMENDLNALNFDESTPEEITDAVFQILNKYVETTSMKILVSGENGMFEEFYSSHKEGEKISIKPEDAMFNTLMNLHHRVVFKDFVEHGKSIGAVRGMLQEFMECVDCEGFILLTEGRQIIGIILLGPKESGNIYSEYDFNVFNKLYSNFFVVGYYVKNIMNEEVVGTVNREIRMSGQIITSLQENMDFVQNRKVDIGYLMVPAHNIGGEFVDMIRLTDTRHLFVIGSLSGKGIAASMDMIILKSLIRTFLAEITDFKMLVAKLNVFIRESLPKGTFFSGVFGLMDFATDTFYYINCGTPALFEYTKSFNNIIEIQGEGHILGFVRDITPYVSVKKIKLSPGDIILACTDGLIESRSLRGDSFGKMRLQNCIMENTTYSAQKMCQFSHEALLEFTSKELDDDITMIVIKYNAEKGGK